MKYCPPSLFLRFLLGVLLLATLGGCKIFHPYRLPTPKASPEFIAQQKAAKKARKAEESLQKKESGDTFLSRLKKKSKDSADESATDVSTPTGSADTEPAAAPTEARTLPERSTVKYDKHGIMKKPKLMRRRIHKPSKPFRPWQSIRNFFKYDLHAKPNYSPDHRPAAPAPKSEPDAAPDASPDWGPGGKP